MSNPNINPEGDERLTAVRKSIADLSGREMIEIASIPGPIGDKLAVVLDSYEQEIIRLQEINGRLRNKNRNYRTGIKALQRAHEASLHRESVQQTTIEYLTRNDGSCQIVYDDGDGPYTPIRFNNEQARVA